MLLTATVMGVPGIPVLQFELDKPGFRGKTQDKNGLFHVCGLSLSRKPAQGLSHHKFHFFLILRKAPRITQIKHGTPTTPTITAPKNMPTERKGCASDQSLN